MFSRALIVVLVAALTACARQAAEPGMITREQFIQVNVDLRRVPQNAEDAQERRQRVLDEHGLTQEQILDFIERSHYTTHELRSLWSEISDRLEEAETPHEHMPSAQSI